MNHKQYIRYNNICNIRSNSVLKPEINNELGNIIDSNDPELIKHTLTKILTHHDAKKMLIKYDLQNITEPCEYMSHKEFIDITLRLLQRYKYAYDIFQDDWKYQNNKFINNININNRHDKLFYEFKKLINIKLKSITNNFDIKIITNKHIEDNIVIISIKIYENNNIMSDSDIENID